MGSFPETKLIRVSQCASVNGSKERRTCSIFRFFFTNQFFMTEDK